MTRHRNQTGGSSLNIVSLDRALAEGTTAHQINSAAQWHEAFADARAVYEKALEAFDRGSGRGKNLKPPFKPFLIKGLREPDFERHAEIARRLRSLSRSLRDVENGQQKLAA